MFLTEFMILSIYYISVWDGFLSSLFLKEMARKGHASALQSKNNEWALETSKKQRYPLSHREHVFALRLISHN